MNPLARSLFLLMALIACCQAIVPLADAAEPSEETARASLARRGFPWYDAKQDDFRHLDPPKHVEPSRPKNDDNPDDSGNLFQILQKILLWGVLITLIAAVAVIAVRTWQDSFFEPAHKPSEAAISLEALEALPEPVRKVHDLLGEAARLVAEADFAAAILFYYSWQLVQLDRHQHIELQKGKTNRQYQREVSASMPGLIDAFSPSRRLFEDAFFGQLPIDQLEFQQVWNQRHRFDFDSRRGRS